MTAANSENFLPNPLVSTRLTQPQYIQTSFVNGPQDFHGILILEPCNYASNVAFCHAAAEICNSGAGLSMSQEYAVAIIQVGYS